MGRYNTKIELNVRIKDIKEYHFFTNRPCPVDLALIRAGYPKIKDRGLGVMVNNIKYITPGNIQGYARLQKTMIKTYKRLDMRESIEYAIKATLKLNL